MYWDPFLSSKMGGGSWWLWVLVESFCRNPFCRRLCQLNGRRKDLYIIFFWGWCMLVQRCQHSNLGTPWILDRSSCIRAVCPGRMASGTTPVRSAGSDHFWTSACLASINGYGVPVGAFYVESCCPLFHAVSFCRHCVARRKARIIL